MAEKRKEGEQATPKWLETIQLNSWEAELLISALVLYALFQVPDYLDHFARMSFDRGSRLLALFRMVINAIDLLKWGYILHILVRGMWVASVGFSYVFPDGVKKDRLKFQGKFGKELEEGSLVKSVLRLEELSSIIYGLSFLLFGSLLGVSMLFFLFILFVEYFRDAGLQGTGAGIVFTLVFSTYFVSIMFLLIDFFSNGLLRRIDWTAKIFYPLARVFRILSLSFLYRRSLLVLISNLNGWKAYMIPILLAALISGYLWGLETFDDSERERLLEKHQEINLLNQSYENLINDETRPYITIQSDIVSENVLRVFLSDLSMFRRVYSYDTTKTTDSWIELPSKEASRFLNKWLIIEIDSVEIDQVDWFITQHIKSLRYGYIGYVDLADFSHGSHGISFKMDTLSLSEASNNMYRRSIYHNEYLANIHFFYDKQ